MASSLVTVTGGDAVGNENSAYALPSWRACTTLAVSFQLVLVVGQSDEIMPINVADVEVGGRGQIDRRREVEAEIDVRAASRANRW